MLLFLYDHYYPCGGLNDFYGTFKTKFEVYDFIRERNKTYGRFDNYQIVDAKSMLLIERGLCERLN